MLKSHHESALLHLFFWKKRSWAGQECPHAYSTNGNALYQDPEDLVNL